MKMKKNYLVGVILTLAVVIAIPNVFATDSAGKAGSSTNGITAVEEKVPHYPVNEQGQTYGHGPYPYGPTQEPDLIRAEGENGVVGYVKASDLDSAISSTEEAITYQKSMQAVGYKLIPLYESDGKKVIGEFRMYPSKGD
ncbi:hypothetical protein P4V47_11755 [Brevibacillus laterosporus]|uniref:hypothetical protein n=1 Tax=Brevibacillus laterosporus TaxID=1465 RepID=UPI002E235EC1|nr:hypothetical protein [Brevibacillus laterosporus]